MFVRVGGIMQRDAYIEEKGGISLSKKLGLSWKTVCVCVTVCVERGIIHLLSEKKRRG